MSVWYYARGVRLRRFLQAHQLPPGDIGTPDGVPSALICTTDPDWDDLESCSILVRDEMRPMSREQMAALDGGLYRIELRADSAPLTWNEWVVESGIRRADARDLYQAVGADKEARAKLRLSLTPVARSDWVEIRKWRDGRWTAWNFLADPIVVDPSVVRF